MSNFSNQSTASWYQGNQQKGFLNRRKLIDRYRSPATIADEIYRILKWGVQPLLLVFCGVLSFFSYQAFFSHNFSPLFATLAAALLSVVIELGKIQIGGYVFQVPFLSGLSLLRSSFPAFAVWAGATLLTAATFTMSVINSTTGAAMLAQKSGFEKNEKQFTPNTADIDEQIKQANERHKQAGGITWKGIVTYQAQKTINKESSTIKALADQRQEIIKQQRADFERSRAAADTNTNNGAAILMAAGGWVELLQLITLFLVAASMATISARINEESEVKNTNNLNHLHGHPGPLADFQKTNQNRTPIGFTWSGYGDTSTTKVEGVTHRVGGVTHQNADDILRLAKKDFGSWAANVGSRKHDSSNASRHIKTTLDKLLTAINLPEFSPSMEVGYQTYQYFATRLKELEQKGYPYDSSQELLKSLAETLPQSNVVV